MHVTVLQENLIKVVSLALRFTAMKPQIPVLTGIALRVRDGNLRIQSTDLRVGFQTVLAVKSDIDGDVVVPAKIFSEFLHTLSPGPLELRLEKEVFVVSQKNARARISTFASAEFPPFPENSEVTAVISHSIFVSTIESVLYAASADETRPVLASLLFAVENQTLTCVCTDGYRLAVVANEMENSVPNPIRLLLPARAIGEALAVARSIRTENVHLSVSQELSQLFVTMGEYTILLRLVEGQYPPYEKIIPATFSLETVLSKDEWVSALKTAMVFARESSSIVTLLFSDGKCIVSAVGGSVGENEVSITSSAHPEEEKKISFNGKYLLDVLSHIDGNDVVFKMTDELKPGLILPEGKEYPLSVVMPFKR